LGNNQAMLENEENKVQSRIEVIDSGPLKITGNFIINELERNNEYSQSEVLLCRCGRSCNKPFCDESHKTI
jgi:CDGSH iron-sulfur domain-containing protein 3